MRSPKGNPCSDFKDRLLGLLRDAALMQMGQGLDHDSEFMESAREKAQERFGEAQKQLDRLNEELERLKADQMLRSVESLLESGDLDSALGDAEITAKIQGLEDEVEELIKEPQGVSRRDYDETLRDLEEKGLIERGPHTVRLTSRGARAMGQGLLARILLNLERRGLGPHSVEDAGTGAWTGSTVRPYEPGDPDHRINIERTLMAALERAGVRFLQGMLPEWPVWSGRSAAAHSILGRRRARVANGAGFELAGQGRGREAPGL